MIVLVFLKVILELFFVEGNISNKKSKQEWTNYLYFGIAIIFWIANYKNVS